MTVAILSEIDYDQVVTDVVEVNLSLSNRLEDGTLLETFLSQLRGDPDYSPARCPSCGQRFDGRSLICGHCGYDANWDRWVRILASWEHVSLSARARRIRGLGPVDRAYVSAIENSGRVGQGGPARPSGTLPEPGPESPRASQAPARPPSHGLVSLFGDEPMEGSGPQQRPSGVPENPAEELPPVPEEKKTDFMEWWTRSEGNDEDSGEPDEWEWERTKSPSDDEWGDTKKE